MKNFESSVFIFFTLLLQALGARYYGYCKEPTFETYESWVETGDYEEVSSSLTCSNGARSCGLSLTISKSYSKSISHTTGFSFTTGEIWKGLKIGFDHKFGQTWTDTTSRGNTYSCTVSAGKNVVLRVRPKFGVVKGKVNIECCTLGFLWESGSCEVAKSGEVEARAPLKNDDGSMKGNYQCHAWGGADNGSSDEGGQGQRNCRGKGVYAGSHDQWCVSNCAQNYCPGYICQC